MLNYIKQSVKTEIEERLVGTELPYHNLKKKLYRIASWWNPGFSFSPEFDLASVPVTGPIKTEAIFTFMGYFVQPDNSGRQESVSGHFGPITIRFDNNSYKIDFTQARFTILSVGD